ncbi:hypothetical protein SUGI_1041360 [Cryptomeria japonica]|nr:hypothetical protein SUGI_1041360 [Cryptomeria japonica]
MGKAITWALFIILLLQIYSTSTSATTPNDEVSASAWDYLSLYDCIYDPHHDYNCEHIDVAQDGTAYHTTVQAAVDSIPARNSWRVKIFIRAGTYREKVNIPSNKSHISFIGDGIGKTILTWNDNASSKGPNGKPLGTSGSASTTIESEYFCAKGITFENTAPVAPPGADDMQAVALRVAGDKALFIDCQMVGHQDTLYDHSGRHFFLSTATFGEYKCGRSGADNNCPTAMNDAERRGTVSWATCFTYDQVLPYLSLQYIDGQDWLKI